MAGKTLSDKVWERHIVRSGDGLPDLLYIDLLIHGGNLLQLLMVYE